MRCLSRAPAFLRFCAARSFLHRREDELGDLPSKSLHELKLDRKPVMTVPATMPALHAFAAMARAGVSAAGVTAGEGGPLGANLSARRALTPAATRA